MARHLTAALLRRLADLRLALTEAGERAIPPETARVRDPDGSGAGFPALDAHAAAGHEVSAKRRAPDLRVAGTRREDDLRTGAGDDVVRARGGDDLVRTGRGDDVVRAGAGDDMVRAGGGADRALGGGGADALRGGAGRDLLQGGRGGDRLHGGGGGDDLRGNGGGDRLWGGAGEDDAQGGGGGDRIHGGGGADDLRGDAGADRLAGGAGGDRLTGGAGADRLRGGGGRDRAFGGVGDDDLRGGGGADSLSGGAGDDALRGGGGSDLLLGGAGRDRLFGGGGDDRLNPGDGPGKVVGGAGDDVLELSGEASGYRVEALAEGGPDALAVTRLAAGETIRVFGVERVAYQGADPETLKVVRPVGAVVDLDPAPDRLREDAAPGEAAGLRLAAMEGPVGGGGGAAAATWSSGDPRFVIGPDGVLRVAPGAVFDAGAEPEITLRVRAKSATGAVRDADLTVRVVAAEDALTAALAIDSGPSADDGVTRSAALRIEATGPATRLTAAVNGGTETDLLGDLDVAGRVVFTPPGLADGDHEAVLRLGFADGSQVSRTLAFTLDREGPQIARFALAASSDTGARGDGATGADVVRLVGRTEAGARLDVSGAGAVADVNGDFAIAGVANPDGANVFRLTATDLAGNVAAASLSVAGTAEAVPAPVADWTRIALERAAAGAWDAAAASTTLALVATAMHEVVAAFDGAGGRLLAGEAPAGGALVAAVAAAAHGVLAQADPASEPLLDRLLADHVAGIEPGAAASGRAFGAEVATRAIRLRAFDGRDDFEPFEGSDAPGAWRPADPRADAAESPELATLRPWALDAPDQLRPDAPPSPTSAEHAAALAEVRSLGALHGAARSPAQTEAALFWDDGPGGASLAGRWLGIALDAAQARGLGAAETAELLAAVSAAVADALIAAWDAAFADGLWRPSAAIRRGAADGDPATPGDAEWAPLLADPSRPASVSAHAAAAGAAATVLAERLGEGGDVSVAPSAGAGAGGARSYGGFGEVAREAAESRVWGGVGLRFAIESGLALGEAAADRTLEATRRDADLAAPTILFDFDADLPVVGSGSATLSGLALDGLTGLAALDVRVDGGAAQTVDVDADGAFSFVVEQPGDGAYAVTFEAVDAAGNAASRTVRAVLDAEAPTIALTMTPGDGSAGSSVVGLIGSADGTGSDLASLSWSVDGGAPRALPAGRVAAGFDLTRDLASLAPGEHAIAVEARDAAGNTTVETVEIALAQAPAFRAIFGGPVDGEAGVGPSARGRVVFSRPVDPATFDAESVFATDPAGARIPAGLRLSSDGLRGALVFDGPLPGAARVTLHLDASRLRSVDGAPLEAGQVAATSFVTASRTPAPGTTLAGRVLDPGPDGMPWTADDVSAGPDGAVRTGDDLFARPLAGATVHVLGLGGRETAVVDAHGWFELTQVPSGPVRVAIDGRGVVDPPDGVRFARMVFEAEMTPGVRNVLGGADPRLDGEGRAEVHLPRIADGPSTPVSAVEGAEVGLDAAGAPGLKAAWREAIRLSVAPGALENAQGAPVDEAAIRLSSLPPELLRARLPDGLQQAFGVLIEAPGIDVFAAPARLTLPNVFGAAPGAQLALVSVSPATGRVEVDGTATVSVDGLTATTDAGAGIAGPGWHGLAPPGGLAFGEGPWPGASDLGFAPPGTGAGLDRGDVFVAVGIDGLWRRTTADADGSFELFLPALADYELRVYHAASGLLATSFGTTPVSGQGADLSAGLVFRPAGGADADGDGLPDAVEQVLGTSPRLADGNGDGLDDAAALRLGLDPLAVATDAVGPVAALQLSGSVEQVLTLGRGAGAGAGIDAPLAVLRTEAGLAILDLSDPRAPILLREATLARAPVEIGFDPGFGRLTVVDAVSAASYALGDLIVRGAEAPAAVLASTGPPGGALHVARGVAYLGVGGRIEAHDVATGARLAALDLGRGPILALTGEGDLLAAVTADGAVVAASVGAGGEMTPRGGLAIGFNQADQAPVLAGGLLHLPAGNGFTGGYATVDLSDPDAPILRSGPDDTALGGEAMALNGSGLALLVGAAGGADAIDLIDVSDPQVTDARLVRFETGAAPRSVAIGQGLGYVGLQDGRLLAVDYVGRDLAGLAPVVTLGGLPEDVDPLAEGRQTPEGAALTLSATVTDDVQVARVQVLLNGRVVQDDAALPADLSLRLPTLDALRAGGAAVPAEGALVTVQVRAFDTAGRMGASSVEALRLIPDDEGPVRLYGSLEDGDAVDPATRAVRLLFSERLDEAALGDAAGGAVRIARLDGERILPEQLVLGGGGREVTALFAPLPQGALTLEIEQARIADALGNVQGDGVTQIRFSVGEFNAAWSGAASDRWSAPGNWLDGAPPQAGDAVRLDGPGDGPVRLVGAVGSAHVAMLLARDAVRVEAGALLRVSGDAVLERLEIVGEGVVLLEAGAVIDELVIDRGSLMLEGTVLVAERLDFAEGRIAGPGRLIVTEDAVALLGDAAAPAVGRDRVQRLELAATLELRGEAALEDAALRFEGGYVSPVDDARVERPGALVIATTGRLELRGDGASLDHWRGEIHGPFHPPADWTAQPGGLTNDGLVRKTGGGESRLDGEIGGAGDYAAEDGALIFEGRVRYSTVREAAELHIRNGALIMDEAGALPRLTVEGGAVVGLFDLQVTERLILRDGASLQGPGKVVLAEGAEGLIGDREAAFDVDPYFLDTSVHLGGELEVRGALQIELAQLRFNLPVRDVVDPGADPDPDAVPDPDAGDLAAGVGRLHVTATGSLDLVGRRAQLIAQEAGRGEALRVDGALGKTGAGEARLGVPLSGDGVFDFAAGAVSLTGGVTDAAAFDGASDLRLFGGTLRVADGADLSVGSLTLGGGDLEILGDGRLTVLDRLDWRAGAVGGAGELRIGPDADARLGAPPPQTGEGPPSASLTLGATLAIVGEAVFDHGRLSLGGAGPGAAPGGAPAEAGRLEVRPGGLLRLPGHGAEILAGPGTGSAFVNDGEVIVEGALRTRISLTGSGTWSWADGVLVVTGGRVDLSDAGPAQAIVVEGGALILDRDVALARLDLQGGEIAGAGRITVTESLEWTAGTLRGDGALHLAAGAVARLGRDPDVDGPVARPDLTLARLLTVEGDVRHLSARLTLDRDAGGAGPAVGAIDIAPGASWTFEHFQSDIDAAPGAGAVLRNDGVLRKIGGGVSSVDADGVTLDGAGRLEALDGELRAGGVSVGAWSPAPPAPRPGDPLIGGETLTLTDGVSLDALTLAGGRLVVQGDVRIESLTFLHGVIAGDGDLTLGARFNWEGGRMTGAGETLIEADATAVLGAVGDRGTAEAPRILQLDRELTLLGDARLEQARLRFGGTEPQAGAGASVDRPGRLNVAEGATLDFVGAYSDLVAAVAGPGRVDNDGVLRKLGRGVSDLGVEVSGEGALVQQDGPFRVVSGGVLRLDGDEGIDRLVVSGGVVEIEGEATLASLELLGGRVQGAGALRLTEALIWRGGALAAEGGVDLLAGAEGDFGSGRPPGAEGLTADLDLETTLSVFGAADLRDGRVDLGRRDGDLEDPVTEVGRLHVRSGAELSLHGPAADIASAALDTPVFGRVAGLGQQMSFLVNDGVIRHGGEGRARLSGLIEGEGAFVSDGPGPGFEVGPNGALVLGGGLAIDAVHVAGGVVHAGADATLARLTMAGGLLTGAGDVFVSDRLEVGHAARLAGPGRLVLQENAEALFGAPRAPDAPPASAFVTLARDLRIEGEALFQQARVDVSGTVWDPARSAEAFSGGAIEIAAGGALILDGHGVALSNGGAGGESPLRNDGALRRTGPGLAEIGLDYAGEGELDLAGGDLVWVRGADVAVSDLAGAASLQVDGARLHLDQDVELEALILLSGRVFGDGDLTVTDHLRFEDGEMHGDGDLILAAGATALFGESEATPLFSEVPGDTIVIRTPALGRDALLAGAATVERGRLALHDAYFDPVAGLTTAHGATVTILPEGVLELAGPAARIDGARDVSAIVNEGLLRKTGPGEARIDPDVDYRAEGGVVQVLGGALVHGVDDFGF